MVGGGGGGTRYDFSSRQFMHHTFLPAIFEHPKILSLRKEKILKKSRKDT